MWDLQRNGGSMPATMERILAGRGLDAVRRPLFSLSDLLPPPHLVWIFGIPFPWFLGGVVLCFCFG